MLILCLENVQDNVVWSEAVKAGGWGHWELASLIIHEGVNAGGEGVPRCHSVTPPPLKAKV